MKNNVTLYIEKISNSFSYGFTIMGYTAQQMRASKKNALYTALNPAYSEVYYEFTDDESEDIINGLEVYSEINNINLATAKIKWVS